jgi:hypothetical protein
MATTPGTRARRPSFLLHRCRCSRCWSWSPTTTWARPWLGFITGKLSDIAGLVFVPLLLAEVVVAAGRLAGRPVPRSVPLAAGAAALTGLGFALVKTTETGIAAYREGLGAVQWVVSLGFARGEPAIAVAAVADPTDLLALPALVVSRARGPSRGLRACRATRSWARPGRREAVGRPGGRASPRGSRRSQLSGGLRRQRRATDTLLFDAATRWSRHLAWSSGVAGSMVTDGRLTVDAWSRDPGRPDRRTDIRLTLVPEEPLAAGCAWPNMDSSSDIIIGGSCAQAARGGALATVEVVRDLLPPGSSLSLELEATLRLGTSSQAAASAAAIALTIGAADGPAGRPRRSRHLGERD